MKQKTDKIIIDRIEDGTAVLEIGLKRLEIPAASLPDGAREGSVLEKTADGLRLLPEETKKRREEMAARTNALFKE